MKSVRAWLRAVAITGALAISITGLAVGASATSNPAAGTGLIGACNMLNAWGVGENGGMANAMSVDNANGDDGMWHAVEVSGCQLRP